MHGGRRVAEQGRIQDGIDQRSPRNADHQQAEQGVASGQGLPASGQVQTGQHQHRGDAGADGRLGKGDIHRIQVHEQCGGQQTVYAEQHHHREQIGEQNGRHRDHDQKTQQGDVDQGFDEPSPPSVFVISRTPAGAGRRAASPLPWHGWP